MFMGWKKDAFDTALLGEAVSAPHAQTTHCVNGGGIVAGTQVATPHGWRGVEAIAVGDEVMTFDGGLQRVIGVSRSMLWTPNDNCPEALWPLHVPQGLIGNRRDLRLLPDAVVMIESDLAEQLFDDPFALIPAQALECLPGVERVHPGEFVEVVTLSFEQDEMVFAEGAALVFCPMIGASDVMPLNALFGDTESEYNVLPLSDAKLVASALMGQGEATAAPSLAMMAA